jgi:methyl-accepting chemotaxis protein
MMGWFTRFFAKKENVAEIGETLMKGPVKNVESAFNGGQAAREAFKDVVTNIQSSHDSLKTINDKLDHHEKAAQGFILEARKDIERVANLKKEVDARVQWAEVFRELQTELNDSSKNIKMIFDDEFGQFGKQMNDFTAEQNMLAEILKSAGRILHYTKDLDLQFELLNVGIRNGKYTQKLSSETNKFAKMSKILQEELQKLIPIFDAIIEKIRTIRFRDIRYSVRYSARLRNTVRQNMNDVKRKINPIMTIFKEYYSAVDSSEKMILAHNNQFKGIEEALQKDLDKERKTLEDLRAKYKRLKMRLASLRERIKRAVNVNY